MTAKTYLSYSKDTLKDNGGINTAKEICHQPYVWDKTFKTFCNEYSKISTFIDSAIKEVDQIILTGAGSSCFIGYSLSGLFFKQFKIPCTVVPTTDIVSFSEHYFDKSHSYLVISFARSGDSPESIAALELADQKSKNCFHLFITCNKDGALNNYKTKNPSSVFNLPPETNDKSLAMTSSYSSMLLTGLLIALKEEREDVVEQLNLVINVTKNLFENKLKALKNIAQENYKRVVFLGSGPLQGTAIEAALKLQELTDGNIICIADTFLGFRHGPKAVVNEETLVVYFFNSNKNALHYELDLLQSMKHGTSPLFQIGISDTPIKNDQLNYQINHSHITHNSLNRYFQPLAYIVIGQVLGFYKSVHLGLSPDNPSKNGAISRVVKGVNIYQS